MEETQKQRAWTTAIAVGWAWAGLVMLPTLYLAASNEGPGDGQSWVMVLALGFGPVAALYAGRKWLRWFKSGTPPVRAPENERDVTPSGAVPPSYTGRDAPEAHRDPWMRFPARG